MIFIKISEIDDSRQSGDLSSDYFYLCSSRDAIVKDRSILKLIIDEPCLRACEYLYDCNIRTIGSSANYKDIDRYGWIGIEYDSLDEDNKKIGKSLVDAGILKQHTNSCEKNNSFESISSLEIDVPINSDTTVEEFSEKILEIAKMFQPQDMLHGFLTEDQMRGEIIEKLESNPFFYYGDGEECHSFKFLDYIDYLMKKGEILSSSDGEVEIFLEDGSKANYKISDFIKAYLALPKGCRAFNYFYDENEGKYWYDEELYKKHLTYLENSGGTNHDDFVTHSM